ncbi:hypothetical protein RDABS01_029659 [Bienertia sinuspersici]
MRYSTPGMNRKRNPGSRSASETMGDKLHRREGNSPDPSAKAILEM